MEDFWDPIVADAARPSPEEIWKERFLRRVLDEMQVVVKRDSEEEYMLEEAIVQFMEAMESSLWKIGPEQMKEALAIAIVRSFSGLLSRRFDAIMLDRPPPQARLYTYDMNLPDDWRPR